MKKYKTLILGLEHFIDKMGYQALAYQHYKHPVKYLVSDASGFSLLFVEKYNADISIIPKNRLKRMFFTVKYLFLHEYTHIEIYNNERLIFFYVLLCKILRKNTMIILRGFEFNKLHGLFWHILSIKAMKICDLIMAKEPHLYKEAKKYVKTEKILFLPNAIKAYDGEIFDYNDRYIDILFLNNPRKDRNLFLLIDSLNILLEKRNDLKILLVGFSILSVVSNKLQPEYQQSVLDYIKKKGLDKIIEIKPFVSNSFDYHCRSKIFVLPSDYIFLNYSMLESMSCGTVPVVTKGDGWERIINEENGYVSDFNSSCFAEMIQNALIKENWEKKSIKTRETVVKNYDIISWGEKILKFKNVI
jgi:glycosyltransferase involved in cell wall biosynthesis